MGRIYMLIRQLGRITHDEDDIIHRYSILCLEGRSRFDGLGEERCRDKFHGCGSVLILGCARHRIRIADLGKV